MNDAFPATHSILSAAALAENVLPDYDIGATTDCRLLHRGLNDTYLVTTQRGRYALRAYRKDWRSHSDIRYELDVLQHLKRERVGVAAPIARADGDFIGTIYAPEGLRHLVLFEYAPGAEPRYEGEESEEAYAYGNIAGRIHAATDSFRSAHDRLSLDSEHLIAAPLRTLEPFVAHRPDAWCRFAQIAERLGSLLRDLPSDRLESGFCHGDLHGWNAHMDANKVLTVFDFDCSGAGWRAYDVAVFQWAARIRGKAKERWPHFIRGYTEQRSLREFDLRSVPLFVAIRHLWLLGLHAGSASYTGSGWINDAYLDRALKFFREWEEDFRPD